MRVVRRRGDTRCGIARCLDLIGGIGSTDVVLVQVETRDWPSSVEMEMLSAFRVPAKSAVKELTAAIHEADTTQHCAKGRRQHRQPVRELAPDRVTKP